VHFQDLSTTLDLEIGKEVRVMQVFGSAIDTTHCGFKRHDDDDDLRDADAEGMLYLPAKPLLHKKKEKKKGLKCSNVESRTLPSIELYFVLSFLGQVKVHSASSRAY
jgi:hypothetical protein